MALDLAGRGKRELGKELEPLGKLVGGDAVPEKGDQVFERRRLSRPRHQAEAIALAQSLVGDADDGSVEDLRVCIENLLDLAREKLLSAAVDHLLEPPDNAQIAVAIDHSEIAAAEPAIRQKGFRVGGGIVVIAEMDRWPIATDVALLPARDLAALQVHQLETHVTGGTP